MIVSKKFITASLTTRTHVKIKHVCLISNYESPIAENLTLKFLVKRTYFNENINGDEKCENFQQ